MTQFQALGLSQKLLKSVAKLGFDDPTPIQSQAIPLVLQGHDVMGLAQTGTGKTAAFGLPLVQNLLAVQGKREQRSARALILAPTRELAGQIADNIKKYLHGTHLRINLVVGGASINVQTNNLSRGTDILVATPGRLLDLVERKALFLDRAKFLVLDEADQMLDLGFIHSLRRIARLLGTPRQTLLFSATMPKQIEQLAQTYLSDPVRIQVSPPGRAADKVRQSVHMVGQRGKADLLKQCLADRPEALSLVFARTKHGAEKLKKSLVAAGFSAGSIHGNKSQGQRERAIMAFRSGEIRILVATDVAARGIDIPGVSHVYNFDLPEVPESYVHRIGRTARAGADGEAVAFCTPETRRLLRDIEKLMGMAIPVASSEAEQLPEQSDTKPAPRSRPRKHRNGRNPSRPNTEAGGEADGPVRFGKSEGPRPGRDRPVRRRRRRSKRIAA